MMTKTELDRLREKADARHLKIIEAIDLVSQLLKDDETVAEDKGFLKPPLNPPIKRAKGKRFAKGELKAHILAIAAKSSQFSITDLKKSFASDGVKVSTGSVKATLFNLRETGQLKVIAEGRGRRATTYAKGKD
jgi:hypothetical protein